MNLYPLSEVESIQYPLFVWHLPPRDVVPKSKHKLFSSKQAMILSSIRLDKHWCPRRIISALFLSSKHGHQTSMPLYGKYRILLDVLRSLTTRASIIWYLLREFYAKARARASKYQINRIKLFCLSAWIGDTYTFLTQLHGQQTSSNNSCTSTYLRFSPLSSSIHNACELSEPFHQRHDSKEKWSFPSARISSARKSEIHQPLTAAIWGLSDLIVVSKTRLVTDRIQTSGRPCLLCQTHG